MYVLLFGTNIFSIFIYKFYFISNLASSCLTRFHDILKELDIINVKEHLFINMNDYFWIYFHADCLAHLFPFILATTWTNVDTKLFCGILPVSQEVLKI